jgi:hypothetical protein
MHRKAELIAGVIRVAELSHSMDLANGVGHRGSAGSMPTAMTALLMVSAAARSRTGVTRPAIVQRLAFTDRSRVAAALYDIDSDILAASTLSPRETSEGCYVKF